MKRLDTAIEVTTTLGGITAVARVTRAKYKTAWYWTKKSGRFPPKTYLRITRELERRGFSASEHLWGMQ